MRALGLFSRQIDSCTPYRADHANAQLRQRLECRFAVEHQAWPHAAVRSARSAGREKQGELWLVSIATAAATTTFASEGAFPASSLDLKPVNWISSSRRVRRGSVPWLWDRKSGGWRLCELALPHPFSDPWSLKLASDSSPSTSPLLFLSASSSSIPSQNRSDGDGVRKSM